MKKAFLILTVILLAGSLILTSCSTSAPAPSSPASSAATAAPQAQAKSITLKFTTHEPAPPAPPAVAVSSPDLTRWWAAQVEEKSQGRIKVNVQWNGILGKPQDFIKMIGSGSADAGQLIGVYFTWETPLRCVSDLPFLTTGFETACPALDKVYADWTPMQDELKKFNLKLLFNIQPHANWMVLNAKQAPAKLSDLAGMKIGPPGASYGKLLESAGITSVSVSAPETYEALQKGVIAGKVSALQNPKTFAHFEVTKYLVDLEFTGGQSVNGYVMNLETWNKLSPDDQKMFQALSDASYKYYVKAQQDERQSLLDFYKQKGMTLVAFPAEEQAAIKAKASKSIWDAWVKEAEGRGIPGAEALKRYQDAVAAVSKSK
jgi:TRAP-type transport system periplasmic protein